MTALLPPGAERRRLVRMLRDMEQQLAASPDVLRIAGHGIVTAPYGWAIAASLRFVLEHGGSFNPPTQDESGAWVAHIDVPLGRYPE